MPILPQQLLWIFDQNWNIKISRVIAASILRKHNWVYTRSTFSMKKTPNKHSPERLSELKRYLLVCLFFDALQKNGKCLKFHHNESWIEIKPIYEKIWRHKGAKNAHSNGGSRTAISCLFGAVSGVVHHNQPNMHSFRFFKSFLNNWENTEPKSAEKFLQLCQ